MSYLWQMPASADAPHLKMLKDQHVLQCSAMCWTASAVLLVLFLRACEMILNCGFVIRRS